MGNDVFELTLKPQILAAQSQPFAGDIYRLERTLLQHESITVSKTLAGNFIVGRGWLVTKIATQ